MAGKQADIKVGVVTNYDDKGIKSAETGLKGFSSSIKSADGFTGKLKAGIGSLGSSLKNFVTSPGGMLAAGGAIAAAGDFAVHAASKFSELGVEIGKLADATGLSNEAASRWKEVAGDIGVESGTLESSIGKLNKTLGANPQLFKDAGIEIARTKDGAIDVNETFLNTVDALNGIENPAKKAELATKLLGKGWQSMAELIGEGSGKLKGSLAEVSDAKVFDDDKVEKARAFRTAMDDLNDVMEDFTLEVGERAAPEIEAFAYLLKRLPGQIGEVLSPVAELAKQWGLAADAALRYVGVDIGEELDGNTDSGVRATEAFASLETRAERLTTGIDVLAQAQQGLALKTDKTIIKTDAFRESITKADLAYQRLTGSLDEDEAWAAVNESIDGYSTKMKEAGKDTDLAAQITRDYTRDIADYVIETDTIPPEKKTEILTLLDQGKLEEAKWILTDVTKDRDIYLNLIARGSGDIIKKLGAIGASATGGRIPMGEGLTLVGEQGPELISAPGAMVYTANQTAAMLNGGGGGPQIGGGGDTHNVTINVNAGLGTNGYEVAKVIVNNLAEYDRRNGTNIVTPAGR